MKILVTGGAGFIGRAVCAALEAAGHAPLVLDNFTSSTEAGLRWEYLRGDIRDLTAVREVIRGCDAVVHLAALVSVPLSIQEPELTRAINIEGFANVLDAARDIELSGPFIYASSAAVYGGIDKAPLTEADVEIATPLSPYAESKIDNETQAMAAAELTTIGLRFFNVYGPGQDAANPYSGVLSKLVLAAQRSDEFSILGDGEQTRDYVHVDDVAAAVVQLLTARIGQTTSVFNVASGAQISLNNLIKLVGEKVGRPVKVASLPPRAGDIKHSGADIAALKTALPGWAPRKLEQGLRDWLQG